MMIMGESDVKNTKFWIILFLAVLCVSLAAAVLMGTFSSGTVANVYKNGECIYSIDLSAVYEGYEFAVSDGGGENVISVENGRICVSAASCPDKTCVHQGWISSSAVPVVCLPNGLVIQIEKEPGDIDAISR